MISNFGLRKPVASPCLWVLGGFLESKLHNVYLQLQSCLQLIHNRLNKPESKVVAHLFLYFIILFHGLYSEPPITGPTYSGPFQYGTNKLWAFCSQRPYLTIPVYLQLILGPTNVGRFGIFNQLKLVRGLKFHCSEVVTFLHDNIMYLLYYSIIM